MDWEHLESNWNHYSGSARAHWSILTDEDSRALTGKKAELVEKIQHRYGITKQEAESQVDEWSQGLMDVVRASKPR